MTDKIKANNTNEEIQNEETLACETQNKNSSSVKISDEVISTIASIAIKDVNGVMGLNTSYVSGIAQKLVKKTPVPKGIKVSIGEDFVVIDISVNVEYGVNIPTVAWEVQDNVKKSVEAMTGLTVEKVNVHIVGVEQTQVKAEEPADTDAENL